MRQMDEAFPDMDYELTRAMEDGQNAIDEGIVTGTNQMEMAEQLGLLAQQSPATT